MLRNMKSIVSLGMALILTASLVAGCGQKNDPQTTTAATTASQAATTEGATEKSSKIVDKPLKLTYWVELDAGKQTPMFSNLAESKLYKELEARTGITMEFIHPPAGQAQESLNLKILSGDYPDILEGMKYPGGAIKAYDDGVILRLNDLIAEHAPNLSAIIKENPIVDKNLKNDKGDIFNFPFIKLDPMLNSSNGPILRKDWLDKVGLAVPETIDEWYTVLKAFRENDPNGNGQKDEVPFIFTGSTFWQMSCFSGAYGAMENSFNLKDGKVTYGPLEAGYKDYLATMQKWYKEGLIEPDFAAIDSKTLDSKVLNNIAGSWIGGAIGGMSKYLDQIGNTIPGFELCGAPWPTLNKGDVNHFKSTSEVSESVFVSSKNKYITETIKWLDYGYSEEGNMLYNFGIEGESYNMDNGYPRYTELITNNPNGTPMAQISSLYMKSHMMGPFVQRKEYYEQNLKLDAQRDAVAQWAKADSKAQVYGSRLTEENAIYSPVIKDCETYLAEMRVKFFMGTEDISKFDDYVAKMKAMKIDDAIAVKQAGHDRYLKR